MDTLAARLEELMRSHGFRSQSQLARRANLPQSTIHRILQRQDYEPSLATLAKLAQTFGVSLAWLAEGQGPMRLTLQEAPVPYPPAASLDRKTRDERLDEAMAILQRLNDDERSHVLGVLRMIDRR